MNGMSQCVNCKIRMCSGCRWLPTEDYFRTIDLPTHLGKMMEAKMLERYISRHCRGHRAAKADMEDRAMFHELCIHCGEKRDMKWRQQYLHELMRKESPGFIAQSSFVGLASSFHDQMEEMDYQWRRISMLNFDGVRYWARENRRWSQRHWPAYFESFESEDDDLPSPGSPDVIEEDAGDAAQTAESYAEDFEDTEGP